MTIPPASPPNLQQLLQAVQTDTAAVQTAAKTKLQTNAALNTAEQNYLMASMALDNALATGTQAQIQAAAQAKLMTNVALAGAKAADATATQIFVAAQTQLAVDSAALQAAIVQFLSPQP